MVKSLWSVGLEMYGFFFYVQNVSCGFSSAVVFALVRLSRVSLINNNASKTVGGVIGPMRNRLRWQNGRPEEEDDDDHDVTRPGNSENKTLQYALTKHKITTGLYNN